MKPMNKVSTGESARDLLNTGTIYSIGKAMSSFFPEYQYRIADMPVRVFRIPTEVVKKLRFFINQMLTKSAELLY